MLRSEIVITSLLIFIQIIPIQTIEPKALKRKANTSISFIYYCFQVVLKILFKRFSLFPLYVLVIELPFLVKSVEVTTINIFP